MAHTAVLGDGKGTTCECADTHESCTSATDTGYTVSREQGHREGQKGTREDFERGGSRGDSASDSENSSGNHSHDGWNVDDDDGTPDEERPVWVYVNHTVKCCNDSDSGEEGVEVAVLAEGLQTLTLTIPRTLAHVRSGVHNAEDFWRRYLREDLLKLSTDRQARVLIASVGCLQYFATEEESDDLASLWSEFENMLADVISCSLRYPLGERKENLLHPVLLWAMTRCQDALLLPARFLPAGESYDHVLVL